MGSLPNGKDVSGHLNWLEYVQITMQNELTYIFSVDNFNIYPNTRLGKLVKAKKLEVNHNLVDTKRNSSTYISNTSFHVFQDILDLCDDFCPGEPPEYFFDR